MPTATQGSAGSKLKRPFATDEARWQAVVRRDPAAEGAFFYSVKTTGVYCRPVCPSRPALRKNVQFHDTAQAAERAGFRPCKRCRPNEESLPQRHASIVTQACRFIEEAEESPNLQQLADAVGSSAYHLHRIFKAQTGLTPKQYAAAHRANRVRDQLSQRPTVTQAIYGAGYNSNSRFYESSTEMRGMTPTTYRAGGRGTTIRFAVGQCWLGPILVAATAKGICASSSATIPTSSPGASRPLPPRRACRRRQGLRIVGRPGRRLRLRPPHGAQPAARHSRHGFSAAGLGGLAASSRRFDRHLFRNRRTNRSSQVRPRRRRSHRRQPDRRRDSLPSRRPHGRLPLRLPLGRRPQAEIDRARTNKRLN